MGGTSARSRPYTITQRSQQLQHSRTQPQHPPFPEQQREFRHMAARPYHNTSRVVNAINPRTGKPSQPLPIPARDEFHNSRAVQLIDQSLTYKQYTPLKISMEELHEKIEGRDLLYLPTPVTKPAHKRDQGRFCKFHDTYGHTIGQCRDLKNQVEDLMKN